MVCNQKIGSSTNLCEIKFSELVYDYQNRNILHLELTNKCLFIKNIDNGLKSNNTLL